VFELWPVTCTTDATISLTGGRCRQYSTGFSSAVAPARHEHFVYYWAHGGLGKTRLLEELPERVRREGAGYYSSGIIDLYHTDTHGTSDVERAIGERLDPGGRWFKEYGAERQRYLKLREMGADSQLLEKRRARLSELFVSEFNQMADDSHKLVLVFDTVELLQYESSLVEERVGLDTVDSRLKPWLLKILSQLRNVLVVFAGRPKEPAPGKQSDPQLRLVTDMTNAFGDELLVVPLQPLTRAETAEFIHRLPDGDVVLPQEYVAVAHVLTGGRPIFLHLLADLLRSLAEDPARVYGMLDEYQKLVELADDGPALAAARKAIQKEILDGIFNNAREFGGYLGLIALMPKGVDRDILVSSTGLRPDEADALLQRLRPLSFAKEYRPEIFEAQPAALDESAQLHLYRLFLHDEMYSLLNTPAVMQNLRMNERRVARDLVSAYYTPRIDELLAQLRRPLPLEERIPLRERLQKMQVERLYYLLVQDPRRGYEEYRARSDEANRERQVGYGMRLLDEFLRFCSHPDRRRQFADAGIDHEKVIRENSLLWLERLHWWAWYSRAVQFAIQMRSDPAAFHIRPEDTAIIGNVTALWARGRAMLYGYEPDTASAALDVLEQVRAALDTLEQVRGAPDPRGALSLARARLATTIGWQLDLSGDLAQAVQYYLEALAAFRDLEGCWDELAMLLNNLAWLYASQGQMILARPLAREALTLNEEHRQRYSTGLTLCTLATIENIDGSWREAQQHADEARDIFAELDDAHGRVLAQEFQM
jgi:hypothetical protein